LARASEAIKAYEPIEHVDVGRDYGDIVFQVRLPEQLVVTESGGLVTVPKKTVKVVFMGEELHAINPTRFPYHLWQEARKQTSDYRKRQVK